MLDTETVGFDLRSGKFARLIPLSVWLIVAFCVAVVGYWVLISKVCQIKINVLGLIGIQRTRLEYMFFKSWK